jgi:copper homeostasis protein
VSGPAVEITVQDAVGADLAMRAGARRIELCSALELGGLTPSHAAIATMRALTRRPGWLHVLVRPRAGGYLYEPTELAVATADVAAAVEAGADGVVVGALTPERGVDARAMAAFVEAAGGRTVTFHRAMDVVSDRARAVETLVDLGVHRVLTSCGATRAADALPALGALVEAAAGRLEVMAGGGVSGPDIPRLLDVGVDSVHLSARVHRRDNGGAGGEGWHWQTDPGLVADAVAAVDRWTESRSG